ncbi:MAG: PucC family protein [Pseudomonadota bacterium]|nr:PucC family protein [Pseudomonadota bacterium]
MTKAHIKQIGKNLLPFSDAASNDLPLLQLLRLSLFQISAGMATVMLLGTLNRVMIVELGVKASLVALMVALPVLIAPLRAVLGFRSDTYKSSIGWKRLPYIWFGTLWQFGGLAIMPFAMIILSGDQTVGPSWAGEALVALAFLMTGLGLHMTQTAGLALAADRATDSTRHRVVALLYLMFLVGMGLSAVIVGALLINFSQFRLIQVVQGAAVVTLLLNLIAMWRQERVFPSTKAEIAAPKPKFGKVWSDFARKSYVGRLIAVVLLGTLAFSMQDILLEPYGGEILRLSVSATTSLTALWALGAIFGLSYAAYFMARGKKATNLSLVALIVGLIGFLAIIFSYPMGVAFIFVVGALVIGFGSGLFAVSTLLIAMTMPTEKNIGRGLALGSWGAAQATAAGVGVALGGIIKDSVGSMAIKGDLGVGLISPATGYIFVYHLEILIIFVSIAVLGPLAQQINRINRSKKIENGEFGLSELPV